MSLETGGPIEQRNANSGALSEKLHGNVYEVPDHLKKWFSYKGEKIHAEGREEWLRDDVVTWDEIQASQNTNKVFDDAYDRSMLNELSDHVYRQRFEPQVQDSIYDKSNSASYKVPEHLKWWFYQNRRKLDNGEETGLDGKVTTDELHISSFTDGKDFQMLDELKRSIYNQRFKLQGDVKIVDQQSGAKYTVPKDLQNWVNQNRYKLDSSLDKQDGTITPQEISDSRRCYFEGTDDAQKRDELERDLHKQRFNLKGDLKVVNRLYNTSYVLPKDLQEEVNQRGYEWDGATGNQDGILTDDEITKSTTYYSYLGNFVKEKPSGVDQLNKAFIQQVSKDPKSLKTWFEQNKDRIDIGHDGKISAGELGVYGTETKLNTYDRTMLVGLYKYTNLFAADPNKTDAYITSESVDLSVKLALHEITPAQIALNNTINPAKVGAALGGLAGGGAALHYSAGLAGAAYSSWGTLTAGSIGTCAAITATGALSGALIGTAAIGGIAYGVNYFAAKDSYDKRVKLYREIGLMK